MVAVVLRKSDLMPWVRGLLASYRVVAPVSEGEGSVRYRPLASGEAVVLDGPRPLRAPKEHFIPQVEPLLTFRGSGKTLTVEGIQRTPDSCGAASRESATVILGVCPCDARALSRLDDVFLGRKNTDNLYGVRRRATLLVGIACTTPSWGCFCTSVGGSPAGTESLDLLLTELGDHYHVAVLSEAGRGLIADPVFAHATEADESAANERHAAAIARMPPLFDAKAVTGNVAWEAPVWMRHARRCLACGACSFLCPTCHCFDIQDEVTAEGGVRFRCWDTCQFGEFTRMGAGHNPRPTQAERLRQRVSHKFKYLVEEFGRMGCTGCGRCVEACPVNIDIRSVLREIEGGER
jgi:sulfhydrogenase subunit beta (sulfur reductase)